MKTPDASEVNAVSENAEQEGAALSSEDSKPEEERLDLTAEVETVSACERSATVTVFSQ